MSKQGRVTVLVGLQRGDEGKGRLSDKLAAVHDIVARYNGGPNAGHTIFVGGQTIAFHQVPAGALYPRVLNVIGNGMYVDPLKLLAEIAQLQSQGIKILPKNLAVSYAAHLILPHHILMDELREGGSDAQGSTKAGIAYVAADKYERVGVRAELLDIDPKLLEKTVASGIAKVNELGKQVKGFKPVDASAEAKRWTSEALKLKPYIADSAKLLNDQLQEGKSVLAEGAQASWLDIDGGMYPYVTSSHPTTGGALNGLRIGYNYIDKVIGVMKAVPSHVGGGPFVTKIDDKSVASSLRGSRGDVDGEFGVTTGRPRGVGWLDLPAIRTSIRDNGVTEVALTKLDTLQKLAKPTIPVAITYKYKGQELKEAPSSAYMLAKCQPIYKDLPLWEGDVSKARSWNDLPDGAQNFISFLETEIGVPITMIGVGPDREQLITR